MVFEHLMFQSSVFRDYGYFFLNCYLQRLLFHLGTTRESRPAYSANALRLSTHTRSVNGPAIYYKYILKVSHRRKTRLKES